MQCIKVAASRERLQDPTAAEWSSVPEEALKLDATPLANQPSEYIKASRDEKQIGKVRNLTVQAAHNGNDIFFRLSWEDETEDVDITDTTVFPDGCGVLLPITKGDPPIDEMGSKDDPVNALYWRADYEEGKGQNTFAKGLGTTEFSEDFPLHAKALRGEGRWTVVFARPLSVPEKKEEAAQLAAGTTVKVGFAVWEGSNGERGGVKSFSKEWRDLSLDA